LRARARRGTVSEIATPISSWSRACARRVTRWSHVCNALHRSRARRGARINEASTMAQRSLNGGSTKRQRSLRGGLGEPPGCGTWASVRGLQQPRVASASAIGRGQNRSGPSVRHLVAVPGQPGRARARWVLPRAKTVLAWCPHCAAHPDFNSRHVRRSKAPATAARRVWPQA
jgi:hypothetical protein